ncbi:hypothetical protein ACFX2B_003215 [Malus domestica]
MPDMPGVDPARRLDMVLHLRQFLRLLHSSADPEPFEPQRSSSVETSELSDLAREAAEHDDRFARHPFKNSS